MTYELGKSHWPESLDDEGVCTEDEEPWENWSIILQGSEAGDFVEEPKDIAKVLKSLGYALIKINDKMKVTKEEVDKAKAAAVEADAAADTAADVASTAEAASYGAWNKYVKLKREYEDERQNGKDKQSRK